MKFGSSVTLSISSTSVGVSRENFKMLPLVTDPPPNCRCVFIRTPEELEEFMSPANPDGSRRVR